MTLKHIILTLLLIAAILPAGSVTIDAETCVRLALETSEGIARARNGVEQARLQKEIAHAAYLPDLSGNATGLWRLPDSKYEEMGMTLKLRGVYMAGLSITQPIYAGGKIKAANKMASIGKEAAGWQLRMAEDNVRAEAETSYWTYVAILSKISMMESYKALVDTAYSRTLSAVEAGMAVRNDLLRVEARRSQIEYQLGQVRSGADLCRLALCRLTGLDEDTPLEPADMEIPVDIPADMESYDLDIRPEMRLLDADVRVKEQQVKLTLGDYLPTVGLMAGWSVYGNIKLESMAQAPDGSYVPVSQTINDNGFNVMLSLSVPLFHWGEGRKKVKSARIDAANSRLTLQENRKLLNLEVRQAIANVRDGSRLLASAETALRQAQTSLESMQQSYRVGMTTLTDLLDAQSQWQTSFSNLIEARTQLRINVVEYLRVTGRL